MIVLTSQRELQFNVYTNTMFITNHINEFSQSPQGYISTRVVPLLYFLMIAYIHTSITEAY